MKRTLEILLIGLLAGGLLTGCPKKTEEKAETDEPATAKQEEKAETAAQEEEEEEEEEKAEVDQENYLKAAFEVSCVRAKIEDTEKQKEILAEVYPRYGFTAESFDEAQKAMQGNETIKVSLQSKMETCTPELAASFAKAGAEGEEGEEAKEEGDDKKEEKEEAKKPAKKWKAGTYSDASVKGGGNFGKVKLMLNITDEGKVLGKLQGAREGKAFRIGLKGEIGSDGAFQASGNQGKNNARVKGRYKSGQLTGSIQGSINAKGYRMTYTAK
jgi:hypothetical protein